MPNSYRPYLGIAPVVGLQALICALTDDWGLWYYWALAPVAVVVLMEAVGISRHEKWLVEMDGLLGALAKHHESLCQTIAKLSAGLDRPDTRVDRFVSGLKGAANVPLGMAVTAGMIGAKVLVGAAVRGSLDASDMLLDAGRDVAHIAAHGVDGDSNKDGSNQGGRSIGSLLDTALPAERARRDLPIREAQLGEVDRLVAHLQARRTKRENWRQCVVVDCLAWALAGGCASSVVALLAGAAL